MPYYFKYAKDKDDYQITEWKPTAVNYLENIIPTSRIKFSKKIGALDYHALMHNKYYDYVDEYNQIIETYDYLNSHKYQFYKVIDSNNYLSSKKCDSYIYQQIKNKLLMLPFSKETIVDTLIYFLYTQRKDSSKKTLWECFGKEIYNNIQRNTMYMNKICPICGRRIDAVDYVEKKYCSEECATIARREYKRMFTKRERAGQFSGH